MQPAVSVIVPVYNAASCLPHCLETLGRQTLKELEIIVVLDCPTDGSEKIAEAYAGQYPNIKLLYNEKNLHVSESRNRGIAVATGEYIGFSDADDFQELSMYEDMYKAAKQRNADVLLIDRIEEKNLPETQCELKSIQQLECIEDRELLQNCFYGLLSGNYKLYVGTVYTHLYRCSFLQELQVKFYDSKQIIGEDLLFNLQIYGHLIQGDYKFVYLPQAYYHYVVYPDSLCHTSEYYKLHMTYALLEEMGKYLEVTGLIRDVRTTNALSRKIISSVYSAWSMETLTYGPVFAFKRLWQVRKSKYMKHALKSCKKNYHSGLPFKKNCFGILLRLFLV